MTPKKVWAVYFSATGTTEKTVCTIADHLAECLHIPWEKRNFTSPAARKEEYRFDEDDIVVLGTPVYAGRVPNVLLPFMRTIRGNGTIAFPVVLYGNRSFDDALAELRDLCEEQGFRCGGAAAFVGEHAFSTVLAQGRPDKEDLEEACRFARKAADAVIHGDIKEHLEVPGNSPSPGYYKPKGADGEPIDIRKVKPEVGETCDDCGLCVSLCPMGSIAEDDGKECRGICIKCGACIKGCPKGARYYTDKNYLYHKSDLEHTWKRRAAVGMWF